MVAEELKESIHKDEIIKDEYGEKFIEIIQKSLVEKTDETVYYLRGMIHLDEYYRRNVEYILKNIVVAKNKNEINFGLRKWIASVTSMGYSAKYI